MIGKLALRLCLISYYVGKPVVDWYNKYDINNPSNPISGANNALNIGKN